MLKLKVTLWSEKYRKYEILYKTKWYQILWDSVGSYRIKDCFFSSERYVDFIEYFGTHDSALAYAKKLMIDDNFEKYLIDLKNRKLELKERVLKMNKLNSVKKDVNFKK